MKRIFKVFAVLMLILAMAVPSYAVIRSYKADVYTWDGRMSTRGEPVLTHVTSGIRFWVTAINASTLETLYEHEDMDGQAFTSLTNPITSTNFASDTVCGDKVRFRTDPTDSSADLYVDLYVLDVNGGYFRFVENFSPYDKTIVIDERPGIVHTGIYRSAVISSTTEVDTELEFDYDTTIHNVWIETITIDAAGAVDVGIDTSVSGDVDGFHAGVAHELTTAGYITQSAANKGALIDDGTSDSLAYVIDGTDEQTMSYAGSSTSNTTGVVNIHYMFSVMPTH